MALLIKRVERTMTSADWKLCHKRYERGNHGQAFGAAALLARNTNKPAYVHASARGYIVQSDVPCLPHGGRYYEITIDGPVMHGRLYET